MHLHVRAKLCCRTSLRIPGSRADDGPEQLALVRLGMILDAVHVAGGDAEHIAGRQQKTLGRLGEELRVALIRIGQGEFHMAWVYGVGTVVYDHIRKALAPEGGETVK